MNGGGANVEIRARTRPSRLPDPPAARRRYTIISVDDHVTEPPDTFVGRLPAKFADRAPTLVTTPGGATPGGTRTPSTTTSRSGPDVPRRSGTATR
jgi:hypothetical protein